MIEIYRAPKPYICSHDYGDFPVDSAVEAFAGVGNPFTTGMLKPGEWAVDLGSGGGFDC
jgi:hypothetical protein